MKIDRKIDVVKKELDLSIVIPSLNEYKNLKFLLPHIESIVDSLVIEYEILVVEGNGGDNDINKIKSARTKVVFQESLGFGNAYKAGFESACGKYVITMDADYSHDPTFIKNLWRCRDAAEVVIASRYVDGGKAYMSKWRKFLSITLNWFYRKMLLLPIRDFSSGFKLYKRETLISLTLTSTNFEIIEEIIIKIFTQGWQIIEIPFKYKPRIYGTSNIRLWKFALSYLKNLFAMLKLRYSHETADYEEVAYYSFIPLQKYWQRKRFKIITEYIDYGSTIIDIGCGSSHLVKSFKQIVGMDISINKIRNIRQWDNLVFVGSVVDIPVKRNSFQTAICSQVIEHIKIDNKIFNNLNWVLVEGGTLILGIPDYGRPWWPLWERLHKKTFPSSYADDHISKYKKSMLFEKLDNHGFAVLEYSYILGGELIVKCQKVSSVS